MSDELPVSDVPEPKKPVKKHNKPSRQETRALRLAHSSTVVVTEVNAMAIYQPKCSCGWIGQCWDYIYEAKRELNNHNHGRAIKKKDYKRGRI